MFGFKSYKEKQELKRQKWAEQRQQREQRQAVRLAQFQESIKDLSPGGKPEEDLAEVQKGIDARKARMPSLFVADGSPRPLAPWAELPEFCRKYIDLGNK
jgi:hypothetical protein